MKVNEKRGNPVEISAVVVWRVQDTAQTVFDVDDYENYVKVQAEAAIRHEATQFAYDEGDDMALGQTTLRSGDAAASAQKAELQARFVNAGVSVEEAKLSHLAYAPEIAQVMQMDDERKAAMVSNLLVVLCSDKETQPIINTGTLFG